MSQFIDKAKIAELNCEIESLRHELQNQNKELEDLKEKNSEDITELEWEVSDYRQHEAVDYEQRVETINKELENSKNKENPVEQFLATLELDDAASVAATIDQYYRKKQQPRLVIVFLLGILVPLAVWFINDFASNDQSYGTIFRQLIDNLAKFISS